VPIVPELGPSDAPAVRFVFPHAPEMAVTCNNGYVMRAWYGILSFDGPGRQVDEAGIQASCRAVRRLIERENECGIPTSRVFLAGFSQGGAMAYAAALAHPETLAGIVALSGHILIARTDRAGV
jgi:phospholipase/carboxylesterase